MSIQNVIYLLFSDFFFDHPKAQDRDKDVEISWPGASNLTPARRILITATNSSSVWVHRRASRMPETK